MAISAGASGVAGFIGAPLINRVLAANGGNWRQAWLIVAGTMILAAAKPRFCSSESVLKI
jgi:hypothetical protein